MPIAWRDAMSVGDDIIDEDPKKPFLSANLYEDAIDKRNPFELKTAFQDLAARRFLHDWIVNHVLRSAMRMRPLLTGGR